MKALVIQQKRIGDVLTSTILADILKQNYPNASVDYMCYSHCKDVLIGNPSINNIIVLDEATRKNYVSLLKFIKKIRKEKYTIVIDAYSKLETNLITAFSEQSIRYLIIKGIPIYFITIILKDFLMVLKVNMA